MQIVSPQTRAAFRSFSRLFRWLFVEFKARWRGFLWRFAPLWVPLVLIWVLPMPREIVQRNYAAAKSEDYSYIPPDPLKRALSEPDNLGAHLNSLWRTRDLQPDLFTHLPNWQNQDGVATQPSLNDWVKLIEAHFHQEWLPPFIASVRLDQAHDGFRLFPVSGTLAEQRIWLNQHKAPEGLELKRLLEVGARREPLNAFWIIALARWEWQYAPRSFYPPPRSNFAFTAVPAPVLSPMGGTRPLSPPPVSPGGTAPYPLPAPSAPGSYPMSPEPFMGPHPLPPLVPNEEAVVKRTFAILNRARRCTYFEDGNWQARREMARDWADVEGVSLEGQRGMLRGTSYTLWSGTSTSMPFYLHSALWGRTGPNFSTVPQIPYAPIDPPEALAQRESPQQLLQWGATLAYIARLVDKRSCVAFSRRGRLAYRWLDAGWTLDIPRSKGRNGSYVFTAHGNAQVFANKARRLRRPDIAHETLFVEQDFAARDTLFNKADGHRYMLSDGAISTFEMGGADALLPQFAFLSAIWCQDIVAALLLIGGVWFFLNLWLIYSPGQPSSWQARWIPAALFITLLGLPTLWAIDELILGSGSLTKFLKEGPPPFCAFVGWLLVLLALLCALVTVARHRSALISEEHDRWHTHLLSRDLRPWFEPFWLGTSALMVLVAEVTLTFFAFVPGSGATSFTLSFTIRDVMVGVGICGLVSGFVGICAWLVSWRFGKKMVWTLTSSGLRWWKEAIGASICILMWLYLLVALAAWPSRVTAKRMIAERWEMGDWVWLQKNL